MNGLGKKGNIIIDRHPKKSVPARVWTISRDHNVTTALQYKFVLCAFGVLL
jgi:hypothetical protein